MNDLQTVQSLTVSVAWNVELETHIHKHYRNRHTATLALQHIAVFAKWYEAKFNQAFEPSLLTNYDFHLDREWSLKQEKVKAATWNSRLWAFGILCEWVGD